MFTRLVLCLLVALGGAGLTMQMAWNSRLRASTGSAVLTTIISVVVTVFSLALVWASGGDEPRHHPPVYFSAQVGLGSAAFLQPVIWWHP